MESSPICVSLLRVICERRVKIEEAADKMSRLYASCKGFGQRFIPEKVLHKTYMDPNSGRGKSSARVCFIPVVSWRRLFQRPNQSMSKSGIRCRHSIHVSNLHNVSTVLQNYILRRWRKDRYRNHSWIKVAYQSFKYMISEKVL